MTTLQEIKAALPRLSPDERTELAGLRTNTAKLECKPVKLPDYAARRCAIFDDRVAPVNAVLEARGSSST